MEIGTLNSKVSFIRDKRVTHSDIFPYDLPTLIKDLKNSSDWKNGELASAVILKSPCKKIVLAVMHDKTEVISFQSGNSVSFHIIEGKIEFHTHKETVILNSGQFLTLYDNIEFTLTSLDASVFLLTFLTAG